MRAVISRSSTRARRVSPENSSRTWCQAPARAYPLASPTRPSLAFFRMDEDADVVECHDEVDEVPAFLRSVDDDSGKGRAALETEPALERPRPSSAASAFSRSMAPGTPIRTPGARRPWPSRCRAPRTIPEKASPENGSSSRTRWPATAAPKARNHETKARARWRVMTNPNQNRRRR